MELYYLYILLCFVAPAASFSFTKTPSNPLKVFLDKNKTNVELRWDWKYTQGVLRAIKIIRYLKSNGKATQKTLGTYYPSGNPSVSDSTKYTFDVQNTATGYASLVIKDITNQGSNKDGTTVDVRNLNTVYVYQIKVDIETSSIEEFDDNVDLQILQTPSITTYPRNQTASGGTVTFECAAGGLPTPIITWEKVGSSESFSSGSPLTIPNFDASKVGTYRCTAKSNGISENATGTGTVMFSTCGSGCTSEELGIEMTDLKYTSEYDNPNSNKYKELKNKLESECLNVYTKSAKSIYKCGVLRFSNGTSLIAVIQLGWPTHIVGPKEPLLLAIRDGSFAGHTVKTDFVTPSNPSSVPPTEATNSTDSPSTTPTENTTTTSTTNPSTTSTESPSTTPTKNPPTTSFSFTKTPSNPFKVFLDKNKTNVEFRWDWKYTQGVLRAIKIMRFVKNNGRSTEKTLGTFYPSGNPSVTDSTKYTLDVQNTATGYASLVIKDITNQGNNKDGTTVDVRNLNTVYVYEIKVDIETSSIEEFDDKIDLQILQTPSITKYPSNQTASGGTVTFECAADGLPAPIITWEKLGSSEIFSSGSPLSIQNFDASKVGAYRCTAKSNGISENATGTGTVMASTCRSGCTREDQGIEMTDLAYTSEYDNPSSNKYGELKNKIEIECLIVYTKRAKAIYKCAVIRFRKGTGVVAVMQLGWPTNTIGPMQPLLAAIRNGSFAGHTVRTDFVSPTSQPTTSFPEDQTTSVICKCTASILTTSLPMNIVQSLVIVFLLVYV